MSTFDSDIERFYTLRKAEFGFLERLELRQSVDPRAWSGFHLEIDLRASASPDARRLLLTFDGVTFLRVGNLQGLVRYMIEICSTAESQVEGGKYKVSESEHDGFSFICEHFTADIDSMTYM